MGKKVERYFDCISDLTETLRGREIFIQVHDFPDPDAVASAYGLQAFFRHHGVLARIVYETEIQRSALLKMITDLDIKLHPIRDLRMKPVDKIILVDGCKGNSNVTDLIGDEIGVIDHHSSESPEDVEFSDIRSDYGACASIVASYFLEAGIPIPKNVATAFMIGIATDTHMLLRKAHEKDLETYYRCHAIADTQYVAAILRNNIGMDDLPYYRRLTENLKLRGHLGFCYFPDGCDQNLMGILANFALSVEEIDFAVLCARNANGIGFSLRSENPALNAADIIRALVKGIGFGGGHPDMAGGVIVNPPDFDENECFDRIVAILKTTDGQGSGY